MTNRVNWARAAAWLRFHGWSNAYWREDWAMAACPHPLAALYHDEFHGIPIVLCGDCGADLTP